MVKSPASKSKSAPSGPPQLYEESNSGPALVIDVGAPARWTNSITAAAPHDTAFDEHVVLSRWNHTAELSPSEGVLCIIGGHRLTNAENKEAAASADFPLVAWTSAQHGRNAKGVRAWQCAAFQPVTNSALPPPKGMASTEGEGRRWPHFAPWWATWEGASTQEMERPLRVCVNGGWAGGRRLCDTRAFAAAELDANAETAAAVSARALNTTTTTAAAATSLATRSHHSVTCVGGVRYRFGGETQEGTVNTLDVVEDVDGVPTAAAESGAPAVGTEGDGIAPATADGSAGAAGETPRTLRPGSPSAALQQPSLLPPPRAAHAACCLSDRYLFIFGGRRVEWPGSATSRAASAGGGGGKGNGIPGKASAAAGKGASRAASTNTKRGNKAAEAGNGTAGGGGVGGSEGGAAPVMTVLRDVALYDTRVGSWLPVNITGGVGPRARFAAAVAPVPTSSAGAASPVFSAAPAMHHREVLMMGGLDDAGHVCGDAWVLQFLSGSDGELMDAGGTAVSARWVRVNVPGPNTSLTSALTMSAANVSVSTSSPTLASGVPSVAAPPAPQFFARHHAALVVSSHRTVFVVGGCGEARQDSSANITAAPAAAAAEPLVFSLALPHLTTTTVHAEESSGEAGGVAGEGGRPASGPNRGGGSAHAKR